MIIDQKYFSLYLVSSMDRVVENWVFVYFRVIFQLDVKSIEFQLQLNEIAQLAMLR